MSALDRLGLRDRMVKVADATSYESFLAAAADVEEASGASTWRDGVDLPNVDVPLLVTHTEELRRLRESRQAERLVAALEEALYRHPGELADVRLYSTSVLGPPKVAERFWDEVEASIDLLSDTAATGLPPALVVARFERAAHVFGRSALLLSGGASLGFFHIGVMRALFNQGLLPTVLSGSSMGAMVACGVAARNDDELRTLFGDLGALRTDALRMLPAGEMRRQRSVYDPVQLRDVILHNNGDLTFGEAFARTGRIVNVSVSPTRERQKPRVLCYLNASDVTLLSAALASSAVPGAFPPAVLEQRGRDHVTRAYMGTETWIDGTFKGDVPKQRLARLHGVNHFIVSQVNPHVAPLGRIAQRQGVVPFLVDAAVSSVRVRAAHDLGLVRRALAPTPLYKPLDLAHSLVDQSYGGDIDIHPRFRARALMRTFANISRAELEAHVLEGERSTWPLIARIKDQTRVERGLARAIARLKKCGP